MTDEAIMPAETTPAGTPAADGDWRDMIGDRGARRRAERYASLDDYAAAHEALVRKLNDAVFVPGEDADPEAVAKYRRRMGVPDSPDGYVFAGEDGAEDTAADPEFQAAMARALHTANVPAAAAQELNRAFTEHLAERSAEAARQAEAAVAASQAALDREWGADKDRNMAVARRAVGRFGDEGLVTLLENARVDGLALGDHPLFVKAFARIGRVLAEDAIDLGSETVSGSSLQERIADTRRQVEDALRRGDRGRARSLDAEERRLWAALAGDGPVVGRDGRAA